MGQESLIRHLEFRLFGKEFVPINKIQIFGEKSDQLDMFQEFKESQFINIENLW